MTKDGHFDQFLDCHVESYQSAGGPKIDKEVHHGFPCRKCRKSLCKVLLLSNRRNHKCTKVK